MQRKFNDIFFTVFPLTGIPFGAATYYLLHLQTQGVRGLMVALCMGIGCGLLFGVSLGFMVRSLEYQFAVDPSIDIVTRLQMIMLNMGYRMDNQFKKVLLFSPTLRSGIFADRVRVEINGDSVTVEGPHWHVEKIRNALAL